MRMEERKREALTRIQVQEKTKTQVRKRGEDLTSPLYTWHLAPVSTLGTIVLGYHLCVFFPAYSSPHPIHCSPSMSLQGRTKKSERERGRGKKTHIHTPPQSNKNVKASFHFNAHQLFIFFATPYYRHCWVIPYSPLIT